MTDQLAVYDETARDMAAPVVGTQFVNTCDLSTRAGKIASAKAVTGALSLNDVPAGTVIDVRDIITMPGVRKARDPRLPNVPCVNTYIIDTEGQAYMSQSEGRLRPGDAPRWREDLQDPCAGRVSRKNAESDRPRRL